MYPSFILLIIAQLKQDLIDRDDSYFKLNQVRALRVGMI